MSATLRHDITCPLAEAIGKKSDVLLALGAYQCQRWGGWRTGHVGMITFAIKLPRHFGAAGEMIRVLRKLSDSGAVGIHSPAWNLWRKLTVSLGLPYNEFLGPVSADEKAFLAAIDKEPGNLATWSAYSDWLTDHDDPRGPHIAALLHPKKAVKCKYGIPVAVRGKLGLT